VAGGYLCTKLFKRELFYDHNIRFREKCILEDSELLVELIAYAKSVSAVEETMYWYSASATSSANGQAAASYVRNICDAMSALIGLSNKLENYEALRPAIEYEIIQMYDYGVLKVLSNLKSEGSIDTFNELRRLRELRLSGVTVGYENIYVKNRIIIDELKIMELNDLNPKLLIKQIKEVGNR